MIPAQDIGLHLSNTMRQNKSCFNKYFENILFPIALPEIVNKLLKRWIWHPSRTLRPKSAVFQKCSAGL